MSISKHTVSPVITAYKWFITAFATLVLGPMVLPFAVDIATSEDGWRSWVVVAPPMVGVVVYALVAAQFYAPRSVGFQIIALLFIGVAMVVAERMGFRGL